MEHDPGQPWRGSIWQRAPVSSLGEQRPDDAHELRRTLGAGSLALIGVSNAIGAGIFVLTGTAAATYAGPAVAISFLIAGFVCLLTALCYAELGAMIPDAGGSYSYARVTLGRLPAWIIGWCMVLEYLVAGATVAVGWSSYLRDLLTSAGINIPDTWLQGPITVADDHRLVWTGFSVNVPAVALILACTIILVRGIRGSAFVNGLLVSIKIAVILLVIGVSVAHVDPGNWVPFIPPNEGEWGAFGWSGVFSAAAIAFFSYSGFEALSTSAREAKTPRRDLPIGLLGALAICAFLYVSMALVMTGLAPYRDLGVASPVTHALKLAGIDWVIPIVGIGTVIGLSSVILVSLYGQSRVFFAMARDGELPSAFGRVNQRTKTPAFGTILTGLGAAIVAGLFPIKLLGELVSMGVLLAFASVCVSVLILRRTAPDIERPFRVPLSPLTPALGALSCFGLMFSLPHVTWLYIGAWIGLGVCLFLVREAYLTKAS